MTTFTTEDREFAYTMPMWGGIPKMPDNWNPRQSEIKFFWPLTEQIELGLDCSDCDTMTYKSNYVISNGVGNIVGLTGATTWASNPPPQLSVEPIDCIGYLKIGGVNIGLKEKPKWFIRQLHRLLGFEWKEK